MNAQVQEVLNLTLCQMMQQSAKSDFAFDQEIPGIPSFSAL